MNSRDESGTSRKDRGAELLPPRSDEPGLAGQRLKVRAGHIFGGPNITRCAPIDLRGSCKCAKCAKRSARTSPPKSEAERAQVQCAGFSRRSTRGLWKAAGRQANAVPLLGWLPVTTAAAGHALDAAVSAAATRGSARSSAAAAAFPFLCAKSRGVEPYCSRGKGRGAGRQACRHAGRRASVRASHLLS